MKTVLCCFCHNFRLSFDAKDCHKIHGYSTGSFIFLVFILKAFFFNHPVRVYRVLVGKPEGKRLLGRPRRRWEDNIRMELQEVGLGYEDWIGLAQDRDRWRALVSAVRNLRVP